MRSRLRSVLLLTLVVSACSGADTPVSYVGGAACVSCHEPETAAWRGSDHDRAMEPATDSTVLGDFSGVEFDYAGVTSRFFRDGDRFMVRTDGPEGALEDFEVLYTFGVTPLQQYLVALEGGRLQALPFAWDTRPGEEKWYHLYPDDSVTVADPLHWTGVFQNWNHMCADCHSTNLVKGYDAGARTFETTWSDIDVSCEACHGPGSKHVAWAERRRRFPNYYPDGSPSDSVTEASMGLVVSVHDKTLWSWSRSGAAATASRTRPRATTQDIPTCGRCHSRRAALRPVYFFGRPFEDTHLLEPPVPPLYHADGQVLEEDYVYASFLQSRMYRAGVTCANCHDPHNLRVHSPGNDLCRTCHDPVRFDAASHHGHRPETPGSYCVDCHMPQTVYMGVDARRDHSFTIPRPALSRTAGVPNACTGCHPDRSDAWAIAELARLGQDPESPAFALAYDAARDGRSAAESMLLAVIADTAEATIRRAGALRLLRSVAGPSSIPPVEAALGHPDPYVRWAAIDFLGLLPPSERGRLAGPLLADPNLSVRIEAARILADPEARQTLPAAALDAFPRVLAEYVNVLRLDADRPEAQTNLGLLRVALGEIEAAEAAYREAIELSPWFASAYVNLADLFRMQGREADGEMLLRAGIEHLPRSADLHHALGLLLVRAGRTDEALEALRFAAIERPDEMRFAYVYAVALHSSGHSGEAVAVLDRALERRPDEPELLFALATVERDRGRTAAALEAALRLERIAPDDPRGPALVDQLSPQ